MGICHLPQDSLSKALLFPPPYPFAGNGWVGKRIETLTPIGGGALSQNGRLFNHATTTNQFSKCHTEKSCFLFFHDIEIEPPPTHGHQIFLDGGGTCESVVASGWWAYATFHRIAFPRLCYFHLTADQRRALCIYRRSPRSHFPRRQSCCRRMPTRRLYASPWGAKPQRSPGSCAPLVV